jgi:signal transduction histidine kinase
MLVLVKEVCEEANAVHSSRLKHLGEPLDGWWDRDAIKRALENLVGSPVKYGAHDTPITIKFSSYHGRAILSAHNEGEAIPPDQMEAVFRVYQRIKMAREGNKQGWDSGLPYVHSVAESHGGTIAVDIFPAEARPLPSICPLMHGPT